LLKQAIDERGFAVIDVGNDRDVTEIGDGLVLIGSMVAVNDFVLII